MIDIGFPQDNPVGAVCNRAYNIINICPHRAKKGNFDD